MKLQLMTLLFAVACSSGKSFDSGITEPSTEDESVDTANPSDTSVTPDTADTEDTSDSGVPDWSSMSAGDLIVTEVQNNPCVLGDDTDGDGNPDCLLADELGEWFEIYNTSGRELDLIGLVIRDDDANNRQQFTVSQSVIINDGGFVVFHVNGDSASNGGIEGVVTYNGGDSGFGLSNSSDEIIIETPDGTIIDQLFYDDDVFPDSKGYSMNLDPSAFDATSNDASANWCVATSNYGAGDFGTPGATNDNCQ